METLRRTPQSAPFEDVGTPVQRQRASDGASDAEGGGAAAHDHADDVELSSRRAAQPSAQPGAERSGDWLADGALMAAMGLGQAGGQAEPGDGQGAAGAAASAVAALSGPRPPSS
ncbi:MAG TPA: hypothetical protein PKU97_24185, partial [Kofleriaceae bacterium]|nr:hypothetical protein [Kofleriaceae bacterium]